MGLLMCWVLAEIFCYACRLSFEGHHFLISVYNLLSSLSNPIEFVLNIYVIKFPSQNNRDWFTFTHNNLGGYKEQFGKHFVTVYKV